MTFTVSKHVERPQTCPTCPKTRPMDCGVALWRRNVSKRALAFVPFARPGMASDRSVRSTASSRIAA